MGEVGSHQDGVSGRESTGLTVANAGVDEMGAFTRATAVAADGHVECWRWKTHVSTENRNQFDVFPLVEGS